MGKKKSKKSESESRLGEFFIKPDKDRKTNTKFRGQARSAPKLKKGYKKLAGLWNK